MSAQFYIWIQVEIYKPYADAKHLKNIFFEHIVFLKIRHMILIASQLVMSFFWSYLNEENNYH